MEEDKTLPHGSEGRTNQNIPEPVHSILWLEGLHISGKQAELKRPQLQGLLKIFVLETTIKIQDHADGVGELTQRIPRIKRFGYFLLNI